jgi:hypothetical protein
MDRAGRAGEPYRSATLEGRVFPKRHRRTINVDGRRFHWHFTTGREADHRDPQLVAQLAAGGSILVVVEDSWPIVTPSFVAAAIREAFGSGWRPESPGQFVLDRTSAQG